MSEGTIHCVQGQHIPAWLTDQRFQLCHVCTVLSHLVSAQGRALSPSAAVSAPSQWLSGPRDGALTALQALRWQEVCLTVSVPSALCSA